MKKVIYTDKKGFLRVSLLRDMDDESKPTLGIPLEPPPIDSILDECKLELHNELVRHGLFTVEDVQNGQTELTSVILGVFRTKLIEAYKLKKQGVK